MDPLNDLGVGEGQQLRGMVEVRGDHAALAVAILVLFGFVFFFFMFVISFVGGSKKLAAATSVDTLSERSFWKRLRTIDLGRRCPPPTEGRTIRNRRRQC